MARNSATLRDSCMFLATDFSMAENGVVVPRSSATVVPAASAAATAAGAAAAGGTGDGATAPLAGAGAAPLAAGAAGARPAARSTSDAVMRPFGPLPPTTLRSTLCFFASCLAYGVAITRPSARGAGPVAAGGGGGGGAAAAAAAGAAACTGASSFVGSGAGASWMLHWGISTQLAATACLVWCIAGTCASSKETGICDIP